MSLSFSEQSTLDAIRNAVPGDGDHLADWVELFTGVKVARKAVCRGHHSPFDAFSHQFLHRPRNALWLGPRGGGKSYLSALDTHLWSRFYPLHETQILGGSLAQSGQIYRALEEVVTKGSGLAGTDRDTVLKLLASSVTYHNGSKASILTASPKSVRGPHVPSLKLDEVDEIDPSLRSDAIGMAMEKYGVSASILMTSTWHRVGGPMEILIEQARSGAMPFFSWCAFEVLERCPEERSGPDLERCPQCPLMKWCHADRDSDPRGLPKAKRSDGHYAIESLIQKVEAVSERQFEADYLCSGPKADGVWFTNFGKENESIEAEYDPTLPVHLSVDSGVFTGAVIFQVERDRKGIRVFADYLAEGLTAEQNARNLIELARVRCGGRLDRMTTDPAGGSRNPIGPTVIAEFERVGLRGSRGVERWPIGSVSDSLTLVDSFVRSASGHIGLRIHPRCTDTIRALRGYRRAKRAGQWQDYPEDPQHPMEDIVDSLRGGLKVEFPEGRQAESKLPRVSARQVF